MEGLQSFLQRSRDYCWSSGFDSPLTAWSSTTSRLASQCWMNVATVINDSVASKNSLTLSHQAEHQWVYLPEWATHLLHPRLTVREEEGLFSRLWVIWNVKVSFGDWNGSEEVLYSVYKVCRNYNFYIITMPKKDAIQNVANNKHDICNMNIINIIISSFTITI